MLLCVFLLVLDALAIAWSVRGFHCLEFSVKLVSPRLLKHRHRTCTRKEVLVIMVQVTLSRGRLPVPGRHVKMHPPRRPAQKDTARATRCLPYYGGTKGRRRKFPWHCIQHLCILFYCSMPTATPHPSTHPPTPSSVIFTYSTSSHMLVFVCYWAAPLLLKNKRMHYSYSVPPPRRRCSRCKSKRSAFVFNPGGVSGTRIIGAFGPVHVSSWPPCIIEPGRTEWSWFARPPSCTIFRYDTYHSVQCGVI